MCVTSDRDRGWRLRGGYPRQAPRARSFAEYNYQASVHGFQEPPTHRPRSRPRRPRRRRRCRRRRRHETAHAHGIYSDLTNEAAPGSKRSIGTENAHVTGSLSSTVLTFLPFP